MKFLTKAECGAWLHRRHIFPRPYGRPEPRGVGYLQFKLPSSLEVRRDFTYELFSTWGCVTSGLLAITDWSYDDEYEDDPTSAMRLAQGEKRSLREVPAQVFRAEEIELAAQLAHLVLERGWTAYWYLPTQTVALLWEGEIIDLWSPSPQLLAATQLVLIDYCAPVLHRRIGQSLWPEPKEPTGDPAAD